MTLGLGIAWQHAEQDAGYYDRVLKATGARRWYNWKHDALGSAGYVPMLWKCRPGAGFDKALAAARAAPRQTWLLGNEPERADQSDTPAPEFAAAAQEWARAMGRSFTALPGILWGDAGRAWLDEYLAVPNRIKPGAWTVHIYGADTPEAWDAQYAHAQNWFRARYLYQPVWVTETNARGDADAQARLLRHLHARSRRGLVAYWYAARDPFGSMRASDLVTAAGERTALGHTFSTG